MAGPILWQLAHARKAECHPDRAKTDERAAADQRSGDRRRRATAWNRDGAAIVVGRLP
jgi:hypothetical protein